MTKKCFVIMPYGGSDPTMQKRFAGVYRTIISPAVRSAGYEPKRSDLAGEPGNITHDIIRDLAEAEIVVADLTTGNPNVFFELGIRHAFRKSGTVHIVDKTQGLPFDIRSYRAIEYTDEMADVPEVQEKIEEAIRKRREQPDRADNPVHDAIPELPIDMRATGDRALVEQLRASQANLELLRKENERLERELLKFHAVETDSDNLDIGSLLDRADEAMKSRGQHAILRLHQAMQEGGPDQFVTLLRKVLESPYLDKNDFMEIVAKCKHAGLDDHRRATLEIARQRYPYEETIYLALVDALDDSPNPVDQHRGRAMLEECLGITHIDGVPRLTGKPKFPKLRTAFGLLFNSYQRVRQYEWILKITNELPEPLARDPMTLRNRARALAALDRLKEAEDTFKKAVDADPTDDQSYLWYSSFLSEQERYEEAYELGEKAILADPEDGRLYMHLAIDILNNGFHRTSSGGIEGPAPRKTRPRFAVPLIVRAVGDFQPGIVQEAVRVLVRADAVFEAQAIAAGRAPEGRYDSAPLDSLVSLISAETGDAPRAGGPRV